MIGAIAFGLALGSAPIRVACVGDSITWGVGVKDPATGSYPARLATMLGPKYVVRNFGNSGTTLTKNTNHPYWNVPEYRAAQAFAPDIVIIKLGTNEATLARWPVVKDNFVPQYKELVKVFRDLPSHPRVYLCLPVPAFEERKPQIDAAVLPLIKQTAREIGAPLIDLYSPLQSHPEMFPDKLHPNDDGAQIMAETVADALDDPAQRKAAWKLVSFDSEEAGEGPARQAIDGDSYTYWHTNYSEKETRPPHELVVDMGETVPVRAFRYLPRQDGGINGRVKGYEVYFSVDGKTWGAPALKGEMPDTAAWTRVDLPKPVQARFFRFVALGEQKNQPWTSVAELDVVRQRL